MDGERKRIDRRTYRRSIFFLTAFFAVAMVIVASLFSLQIVNYDEYQSKVLDQMTIETEVNPERGIIYDRNGNILATNASNYLVIISPQDIIDAMAESTETGDTVYTWTSSAGQSYSGLKMNEFIAKSLSEILGVDYDFVIKKAAIKGRRYEVISKNVSEKDADKIRQIISDYKLTDQIYLRASAIRYYPYGSLAGQVLGFTNSEGVGIYGLESTYNNILEGKSGKYITAQDARNNDMPFAYESYIEAENGYNLISTIDMSIQYELENQLEAAYYNSLPTEGVCGIVMNVKTGEVLAMGEYPPMNPNEPYVLSDEFSAVLSGFEEGSDAYAAKKQELLYSMWNNKAVSQLYEPGSTFKIITTAMALEEKKVTLNDDFNCPGYYFVKGYGNVRCHKNGGHGHVKFFRGLQQSCNPVFMILSERLGTKTFYDYFLSFGYGEKTGIDLPAEALGIISPEKSFNSVSCAVYAFGQTFKTSPIRQLTAISAIANGGYMVTPHLLKEIVDDDGNVISAYEASDVRQVISTDVCKVIADVLEEGVSGDGGAKNAYVKGYKVAAKTGTSEKKDKKDENGQYSFRVGSCVAFAPANDPEVAVIITTDEPTEGNVYGSIVAAPFVSNLLGFVLPYLGYEAEYTDADIENMEVTVAGYVGGNIDTVKSMLDENKMKYEVIGNGDTVLAQIPPEGTKILKENCKVLLYTESAEPTSTVTVPDVVGKTAEAANKLLTNSGLNVTIGSSGGMRSGAIVKSQSIASGETVPKGTSVTIEVLYTDGTD